MPEIDSTPPDWSRPIPSCPGYRIMDGGQLWSSKRGGWRPLKSKINRQGYKVICLKVDGKKVHPLIHRLVLEAFVGPCPPGMEGCHNDGDPLNTFVSNLRWDTKINNHRDRRRHGTIPMGESHWKAKLTEDDIREIFRLDRAGVTGLKIAEIFHVSNSNVSEILRRNRWKHVSVSA